MALAKALAHHRSSNIACCLTLYICAWKCTWFILFYDIIYIYVCVCVCVLHTMHVFICARCSSDSIFLMPQDFKAADVLHHQIIRMPQRQSQHSMQSIACCKMQHGPHWSWSQFEHFEVAFMLSQSMLDSAVFSPVVQLHVCRGPSVQTEMRKAVGHWER